MPSRTFVVAPYVRLEHNLVEIYVVGKYHVGEPVHCESWCCGEEQVRVVLNDPRADVSIIYRSHTYEGYLISLF